MAIYYEHYTYRVYVQLSESDTHTSVLYRVLNRYVYVWAHNKKDYICELQRSPFLFFLQPSKGRSLKQFAFSTCTTPMAPPPLLTSKKKVHTHFFLLLHLKFNDFFYQIYYLGIHIHVYRKIIHTTNFLRLWKVRKAPLICFWQERCASSWSKESQHSFPFKYWLVSKFFFSIFLQKKPREFCKGKEKSFSRNNSQFTVIIKVALLKSFSYWKNQHQIISISSLTLILL